MLSAVSASVSTISRNSTDKGLLTMPLLCRIYFLELRHMSEPYRQYIYPIKPLLAAGIAASQRCRPGGAPQKADIKGGCMGAREAVYAAGKTGATLGVVGEGCDGVSRVTRVPHSVESLSRLVCALVGV